jgi:hypothetical protein
MCGHEKEFENFADTLIHVFIGVSLEHIVESIIIKT